MLQNAHTESFCGLDSFKLLWLPFLIKTTLLRNCICNHKSYLLSDESYNFLNKNNKFLPYFLFICGLGFCLISKISWVLENSCLAIHYIEF